MIIFNLLDVIMTSKDKYSTPIYNEIYKFNEDSFKTLLSFFYNEARGKYLITRQLLKPIRELVERVDSMSKPEITSEMVIKHYANEIISQPMDKIKKALLALNPEIVKKCEAVLTSTK